MKDLTIELVVPSATRELDHWYLRSEVYTRDARINTLNLPWSGVGHDDWSQNEGNFITFGRIGNADKATYRIGRARIYCADLADGQDGLVSMCESVFGPELTEQLQRLDLLRQELAGLTELKLVAPQPAIDAARISLLLAKQRQPASA